MRGPALASILIAIVVGGAVVYSVRDDAAAVKGCSARLREGVRLLISGGVPSDKLCDFLKELATVGIAVPESDVQATPGIDCADNAAVAAWVFDNWDLTDDEAAQVVRSKHVRGIECG